MNNRYIVEMFKNGKLIRSCHFAAHDKNLADWYGNLFAWGTQPEPDKWEVIKDPAEMCIDCDKDVRDYPSERCVGCNSYMEHLDMRPA